MGQKLICLLILQSNPLRSENELELSLVKWDAVKDKFMPRLDRNGLMRLLITRIWNKKGQFQLGHIFEYKDEQAMKDCLPIWDDIERQFKDKIPNIAVGYRGILLDQYEVKKLSQYTNPANNKPNNLSKNTCLSQ